MNHIVLEVKKNQKNKKIVYFFHPEGRYKFMLEKNQGTSPFRQITEKLR